MRLLLFAISIGLDQYEVKFTDIDYEVFTDAAEFVSKGESPFSRSTYRYSPILAYLMVGNQWSPYFGKFLFTLFDLIIGYLVDLQGYDSRWWLYNPLVAIISLRGNAESFVCFPIFIFLYFLKTNNVVLSAIFFGLACHIKIYPIIYAPTALIYINSASGSFTNRFKSICSLKSLKFFISSASTFFILLIVFYHLYDYQFIYESYLYHVIRKDTRHNFSIYFYPLYLAQGTSIESIISLSSFIPQFLLVFMIGYMHNNLYEAIFLQTILFVAFNKVMTSQYLIWYLCYLPFCIHTVKRIKNKDLFWILTAWSASQLFWLFNAYLLEFKGTNTFILLWVSSLVFCLSHVLFIARMLQTKTKTQ